MSRQTFFGIFLIILGVIGVVVGIVSRHITESVGASVLYLLPLLVGVVILLTERASK